MSHDEIKQMAEQQNQLQTLEGWRAMGADQPGQESFTAEERRAYAVGLVKMAAVALVDVRDARDETTDGRRASVLATEAEKLAALAVAWLP